MICRRAGIFLDCVSTITRWRRIMKFAMRLALLCAAALTFPALASPVPGVPKAVIAIAGDTTAEVKWEQDPDAERYIVLRASVSGGPYTVVHEDESGLQ